MAPEPAAARQTSMSAVSVHMASPGADHAGGERRDSNGLASPSPRGSPRAAAQVVHMSRDYVEGAAEEMLAIPELDGLSPHKPLAETFPGDKKPQKPSINVDSIYSVAITPFRREHIISQIRLVLALSVSLIMSLSFFLGATWNPYQYTTNLIIAVVDFDSPSPAGLPSFGSVIGSVVRSGALPMTLTYEFPVAAETSVSDMIARVDRGDYHGAILCPAGGAARLGLSLATGAAYDPTAATLIVYDEGRGGPNVGAIVKAILPAAVGAASAGLSRALVNLTRAGSIPLAVASLDALLTPIGYTVNNLHPVPTAGINTLLGLAFTIVWMMSLVTVNTVLGFTDALAEKGARPDHVLGLQIVLAFLTFGILSLWPICMAIAYGAAVTSLQFAQFWAYTWFCMTVFGACIAWLILLAGPVGGNVLHGIFFSLNFFSSSGIIHPDLEPPFFAIGTGLPMRQGLEGLRTILLGSYDRLPRNLGVLFAYFGFVALWGAIWIFILARRVAAEKVRRAALEAAARAEHTHAHELGQADVPPAALPAMMTWNVSQAVALSAASKAVGV